MRLPDKQLFRERVRLHRMFFRRPKGMAEKGFARRSDRDAKRRVDAKHAALKEGAVPTNRAMRRALGDRGYSHGLGRMDVPKERL
jgi:hypothetical protein